MWPHCSGRGIGHTAHSSFVQQIDPGQGKKKRDTIYFSISSLPFMTSYEWREKMAHSLVFTAVHTTNCCCAAVLAQVDKQTNPHVTTSTAFTLQV